jgi:raffinose/stachyose/melibiose transport system substrate-binding protein
MVIAGLATPVFADTTVSIVDVQESAVARALWDRIAKDYEAEHKGVAVQFKYIEGESYKEKLPTMLQSDSRSALVYSWGGGVMEAQNQAGFLKDITTDIASVEENLAQTAVTAFKVDGKTVGVPFDTGLVAFFYNKELLKKAGVNAEASKTWDDLLGAVKAP